MPEGWVEGESKAKRRWGRDPADNARTAREEGEASPGLASIGRRRSQRGVPAGELHAEAKVKDGSHPAKEERRRRAQGTTEARGMALTREKGEVKRRKASQRQIDGDAKIGNRRQIESTLPQEDAEVWDGKVSNGDFSSQQKERNANPSGCVTQLLHEAQVGGNETLFTTCPSTVASEATDSGCSYEEDFEVR